MMSELPESEPICLRLGVSGCSPSKISFFTKGQTALVWTIGYLSLYFVLYLLNGACLSTREEKPLWKNSHAACTLFHNSMHSQSVIQVMKESLFNKCLHVTFNHKRGLALGTLAFLTAAITQWSLMPLAKIPAIGYLCGALVKNKSMREDLSGNFKLGYTVCGTLL